MPVSVDTSPRRPIGRDITRACFVVALTAWITAAVIVAVDAAGGTAMAPLTSGIATTWLMGAGALGFTLPLAYGDNTYLAILAGALRLGDPELDDRLVPVRARRLRSLPQVGTILTAIATLAWGVSAIFTLQLVLGVYHLHTDAALQLLRLLTGCAIGPTVLRVFGSAEARQRATYELVCEAHRDLRGSVAAIASEPVPVQRSLHVLAGGAFGPRRHREDDDGVAPGA